MSLNNGHIRLSAASFDIIKFVQDILSASSNNISNEKLQIGSSTMGALTVKKPTCSTFSTLDFQS